MANEAENISGKDPLISDIPVATEMPSGDHTKETPVQPTPSINKGFDPQPLHEDIAVIIN